MRGETVVCSKGHVKLHTRVRGCTKETDFMMFFNFVMIVSFSTLTLARCLRQLRIKLCNLSMDSQVICWLRKPSTSLSTPHIAQTTPRHTTPWSGVMLGIFWRILATNRDAPHRKHARTLLRLVEKERGGDGKVHEACGGC